MRPRLPRLAGLLISLLAPLAPAGPGTAATPLDIDPDCRYLEVWVVSPLSLDESLQAPFRERFATHLDRAGFRAVGPASPGSGRPTWVAHTQILKLADGSLIWSYRMRKLASIAGGEIHLQKFEDPMNPQLRERFGEIGAIKHISEREFGAEAVKASDWAAQVYLDYAHGLCRNLDASLRGEEERLERVREQLREEIERVRTERTTRQKRLELDAESPP